MKIKLIGLSILLLTLHAYGYESRSPSLETVMVYADRDTRQLNQVASLVSVIGEDKIKAANLEHVKQIFDTASGVWVSRGEGQEHLTAIRSPVLTGAGACGAFWMGQDGIALRANGFCNVNQLFEAHYEAAKSAEVLKGPQSSFLGGNALYGAIHFTLPKADEVSERYQLNTSQFGYGKLHLQDSQHAGEHDTAIFLTSIYDKGYRDESGFKQNKLTLKHKWQGNKIAINSGISIQQLDQETAGYVEGQDAYKNLKLSRQNVSPEAYRESDSVRFFSRIELEAGNSRWSLTPYFRRSNMDFLMHFVPWQPTEENKQNSAGWQLKWDKFTEAGSHFYWGQDFEFTKGSLTEIQYNPSPFNQAAFPEGEHYDYEVSALSGSLYAGARMPITPAVSLDVGLRADADKYDYHTNITAGSACAEDVNCRFYRPDDRKDDFSNYSGHASIMYEVINDFYVFGQLANGYRLPQTSELYRAQSPNFVELEPEQITQLELGFKSQINDVFLQMALYQADTSNGIYQDTNRLYVNGVETQHHGFEYEVVWQMQDTFSASLVGQQVLHRYSNNPTVLGYDDTVVITGNIIDTAPKQIQHLALNWQPNNKWETQLNWQRMSRYYLDPENNFEYEGHQLVNVSATRYVSSKLKVNVSMNNLFDTRYAERADVASGTPRYFPGKERTVFLGLTYTP